MTTVAPMRPFFRRAVVVAAVFSVLFYWSCERHKPSELAHGTEHAKSHAEEDAATERAQEGEDHDEPDDSDQMRATTAMSVTPPPASPTPANFFPTASPH
ncbi:MAG: hypothetical protein ABR589_06060 [Chthoniobacterales bacterium]